MSLVIVNDRYLISCTLDPFLSAREDHSQVSPQNLSALLFATPINLQCSCVFEPCLQYFLIHAFLRSEKHCHRVTTTSDFDLHRVESRVRMVHLHWRRNHLLYTESREQYLLDSSLEPVVTRSSEFLFLQVRYLDQNLRECSFSKTRAGQQETPTYVTMVTGRVRCRYLSRIFLANSGDAQAQITSLL